MIIDKTPLDSLFNGEAKYYKEQYQGNYYGNILYVAGIKKELNTLAITVYDNGVLTITICSSIYFRILYKSESCIEYDIDMDDIHFTYFQKRNTKLLFFFFVLLKHCLKERKHVLTPYIRQLAYSPHQSHDFADLTYNSYEELALKEYAELPDMIIKFINFVKTTEKNQKYFL